MEIFHFRGAWAPASPPPGFATGKVIHGCVSWSIISLMIFRFSSVVKKSWSKFSGQKACLTVNYEHYYMPNLPFFLAHFSISHIF